MDTQTALADVVILDAENMENDNTFGKETAKTVATTAAASAVIIGGIYAYNRLKPRVVSLLSRHKETVKPEDVPVITDAPEKTEN